MGNNLLNRTGFGFNRKLHGNRFLNPIHKIQMVRISPCETIEDEEKFLRAHEERIKAYEERKEKLHPASREAIERLIKPFRDRIEKYNEVKSSKYCECEAPLIRTDVNEESTGCYCGICGKNIN